MNLPSIIDDFAAIASCACANVKKKRFDPLACARAALTLLAALAALAGCGGSGAQMPPPEPQKLGSGALRPEPVTVASFGLLTVGDICIATETVEETFGFGAARMDIGEIPASGVSSDGRAEGLVLLDYLVDAMPLDSVRVLGLTEHDLFHPEAPECMGLGQIEGKSAIVSFYLPARALEHDLAASKGIDASRELYRSRIRKLVRHELAHTFMQRGFQHCEDPSCLMSAVEMGLQDLDRVSERFCVECAKKLATAVRGPVNTPVTYYNLGLYYEDRGLSDRAVMAYERAVLGDPRMTQALNNLGVVSLKAGRLGSAADYLRRAVEFAPDYALARLNLGRALAAAGDAKGAIEQYEACLAADPGMTAALKEGGVLLRDVLCDRDRAEEWLRRWAESGGGR